MQEEISLAKIEMPKRKIRIENAMDLIRSYGQTDGDHHKLWVIDQVVRALLGTQEEYEKFVHDYCYRYDSGELSEEELYEWDEGIAP